MSVDRDLAVRLAAFEWLAAQSAEHGDVLPRTMLQQGFEFEGARIPLVSPQGIFKPRSLDFPLSISTTPESPYGDAIGPDGTLAYRYRGTDPNHPDNVGLRKAIQAKRPLVYLFGVVPGRYVAVWPVFVVGDNPILLTFQIAFDDMSYLMRRDAHALAAESDTSARRAYITTTVRVRLHQRAFRERVLEAYHSQCSLCRLRHRELLDAAHIIPDVEPEGEPLIRNGLALCKLHHAAFDSYMLTVAPDYRIHLRQDVLDEHDGPVLLHGLQELHGASILLPSSPVHYPDREALAVRFARFQEAHAP
ncbi:MAG TPA: HNH endonuclease [Anaerolineales bacterium]|nr:HNH endonuclease [Anaerolineales bacterium]